MKSNVIAGQDEKVVKKMKDQNIAKQRIDTKRLGEGEVGFGWNN